MYHSMTNVTRTPRSKKGCRPPSPSSGSSLPASAHEPISIYPLLLDIFIPRLHIEDFILFFCVSGVFETLITATLSKSRYPKSVAIPRSVNHSLTLTKNSLPATSFTSSLSAIHDLDLPWTSFGSCAVTVTHAVLMGYLALFACLYSAAMKSSTCSPGRHNIAWNLLVVSYSSTLPWRNTKQLKDLLRLLRLLSPPAFCTRMLVTYLQQFYPCLTLTY